MYSSLNPGAIGIDCSFEEGLSLTARHGFAGYHFSIKEVAAIGVERAADLAKAEGVRLAGWGFPVEFRKDEATFEEDLASLDALAQVGTDLGVKRTSTWIMPCSDTLTYRQNFDVHASRLRAAAEILAEHGVHLGLEYVGPKTLWSSGRYPFIHTMEEMLELCDAVGPNAGLLLDCFHWYTAHETAEDLRRLTPEQIVDVHVNDVPDKPADEQLDNVRDLPGATGVIDVTTFLSTIKDVGYDGPVMVEPFSERVRQLSADEACAETVTSLNRVMQQAGV